VKVVVGSRNAHKVREIEAIFREEGVGFELVTIDEVAPGTQLIEEEPTFEANALTKARQAAVADGMAAIADDSGIEVDALGGRPACARRDMPGEPSDDRRNNEKLLRELAAWRRRGGPRATGVRPRSWTVRSRWCGRGAARGGCWRRGGERAASGTTR
jgi:inosine/xanthosine triphosphate pyrophosphatase family protein